MDLVAIFREFASAAAPAAVAALWQGAMLAAGLAVCLRFARRLSATDRFRVWAAGLAAAAMLPFLPWLGSIGAGTRVATGVGAAGGARPWLDFDPRWTLAIAGAWIAASGWRLVDLAVHGLRLRRLWKRAVPVGFDGAGIEVCATRDLDRPSVIGFFRPRILIPAWLMERLTERELEQVVLHEAEHLRRRDDWMNLAQKLALAVFPLNPALWWMERRMCREREMACDEAVVRATERPRDYAACLTSLAERRLERRLERRAEALSLGAWHRRPELVERVQRILKRGPGLSPVAARGLLALMGCGLVLGSVEFARCPQLVTFAAQPAATADYAADHPMLSGYRVVEAMAPMPSRAELAAMRGPSPAGGVHGPEKTRKASGPIFRTAPGRGERGISPASQAAAPAQPEAMNPDAVAEQSGTPQAHWTSVGQLVVFTAWEQIEEPASTADQEQPAANGSPAQSVAAPQFAVTQLILRVYPNPSPRPPQASGCGPERVCAANPGSGSTDSRPNSSMTPMQQVLPLRDGWLVFQL
jgi:Zn-dependent protease with chaperone function